MATPQSLENQQQIEASYNKRTKKLWEKIDEFDPEEKRKYFSKIIEECTYNQTTNKHVFAKNIRSGVKQVRKKTSEELKLLEYFLEQDPTWSRKTVATAAKVLGLSTYQVYKWGYDRKNRKNQRYEPMLFKVVDLNDSMLDKINKFEQEIKPKDKPDFNQQVEDLLGETPSYKIKKNNCKNRQVSEWNFLSDEACSGDYTDECTSNTPRLVRKRYAKVFKIERVNKKRKTDFSRNFNLTNFNLSCSNDNKSKNHHLIKKNADIDINDRYSDITAEKSIVSAMVKNKSVSKFSQMFDDSPVSK